MRSRNDWLGRAIAYIDANYAKPFRQEDVARHVGLSVNYFSYRFHQETGVPFSDFVARRRIGKAIELVRKNESLSTEEIAERVVRELAPAIVSDAAERLVREETARLTSAVPRR